MSQWSNISVPEPSNLRDIICEEKLKSLRTKQNQTCIKSLHTTKKHAILQEESAASNGYNEKEQYYNSNGLVRTIERQYDVEYESRYYENDTDEEDYECDGYDWDRIDTVSKKCGMLECIGKVENMPMKHNIASTTRNNKCKFMSLSPADGNDFDLELTRKVYDRFKFYPKATQTKEQHCNNRNYIPLEFGLEVLTKQKLNRLTDRRIVKQVNGAINIGKNAVILHADCDQSNPVMQLPKECVIKIFTITSSDIRKCEYDDTLYSWKRNYSNEKQALKLVHFWAEQEKCNLIMLKSLGIPCPEFIRLENHLVVMSFIGARHIPAPKLKDAFLSLCDSILAYKQIVKTMKTLFDVGKFVHGDLTTSNILWYNKQCYFIDVAQSTQIAQYNTVCLLMNDCANIIKFFRGKGIQDLPTSYELFTDITGYDMKDKIALEKLLSPSLKVVKLQDRV